MRSALIKPYRVCSSQKSLEELFAEVNASCYAGHGPDYRYGLERIIVNPLQAYERFLSILARAADIKFFTFTELFSGPRRRDIVQVVIRHDVDTDLPAAMCLAEIENRLGVGSTFFFLHTGHYHGVFQKGVFHRHECVKHAYRRVQELGHEVGLHNDALSVYQQWHADGAAALVTELEWMRSCGLNVTGSVAHGSSPVYGAENYEIFKNRPFQEWEPKLAGDYKRSDEVCCKGRAAPLRILDEAELGLEYEGHDAFSYGDGPIEYGATRFLNRWRWNMQIRRHELDPAPPNTWFADEDTVIQDILGLEPGALVILTVHPVYYGCRYSSHRSPPLRRHRLTCEINSRLGWETYTPESVQCCAKHDGIENRQSINFSNELGMLDRPWPAKPAKADLRILMLGGENLDARHLGVQGHCHLVLERFLKEACGRAVVVRKLAFPGMGVSRLWAWYQCVRDSFRPHIVVLGIDGYALRKNLPEVWSLETGLSASHPPGAYLAWDAEAGSFAVVERSCSWAIHQMAKRPTYAWPANGRDLVLPFADGHGFPVHGCDCPEYIMALYRFVVAGVRRHGALPVLLLEGLGSLPGDGTDRVPIEADCEAGEAVRARLAEMADELGAPLVDPYDAFLSDRSGRTATRPDGFWTFVGHRLAAAALYGALCGLTPCRSLLKKDAKNST